MKGPVKCPGSTFPQGQLSVSKKLAASKSAWFDVSSNSDEVTEPAVRAAVDVGVTD